MLTSLLRVLLIPFTRFKKVLLINLELNPSSFISASAFRTFSEVFAAFKVEVGPVTRICTFPSVRVICSPRPPVRLNLPLSKSSANVLSPPLLCIGLFIDGEEVELFRE